MENKERKEGDYLSKNRAGFLEINSLGQLIPIVLFCFFAAFVMDVREPYDYSKDINYSEGIIDENFIHQQAKWGEDEDRPKINQSKPESEPVVTPPEKKINAAPSSNSKKAEPKIQPQRTEPIIEEKYVEVKPSEPQEIPQSTEHIEEITQVFTQRIKVNPVSILPTLSTTVLEERPIVNMAALTLKENKFLRKPNVEEELIAAENPILPIEEVIEKSVVKSEISYQSADFAWSLNDHSYGMKRTAKFTNTPDKKAAYSRTAAGILLKINHLTDLNPEYGIFVEKSEDAKEYHSIGAINVENTTEFLYFDAENTFDDQHHYRFRSEDLQGETVTFGEVSVVRPGNLNPVESRVDASGIFTLNLNSTTEQTIKYELKEAWGSLNAVAGKKEIVAGQNELLFNLSGEPGLYFLSLKTNNATLELLLEKPGMTADLSFYETKISGKQNLKEEMSFADLIDDKEVLNFDFYLKNGNSLIFNQGTYKSETVKIKNAKIRDLPAALTGRHSEASLWFTAAFEINYLHQKVPVILEHNDAEIPAQINIYAAKNSIRPISHFSPNGDGVQDNWRIPGIESCPKTQLLVFNDWGNLVYKSIEVTNENIWNGQKDGQNLPEGIYFYVLGNYGGWVQLER